MNSRTKTINGNLSPRLCRMLTLLAALLLLTVPSALMAQTAGEGTISGTVTDSTGAVIPNATVTATNKATNVATRRTSSSAGLFTIAPLPPGTYSVRVEATGFKTAVQDNLVVNALAILTYNPVLNVGEATEVVSVSAAPPPLDTANATLSTVMDNETYANLPLQMNNAQRDPTAFASLVPGAQSGTRLPIVGGTGNFLGQLYLDGMPAETINQQGDNRLVSQAMDLDAVDQFQVVTSTPPAEYSGAGAANFTMKSGGNKYHGQVSDFVRNTIFDAWSFTAKAQTTKNALGQTIPAPKPVEHQNELSVTFGGKVPHTANKLYFFVAYDKFHSRRGATPSLFTIPSTLMNQGDFTELNGGVGGGGLTGTGSNNKPLIYDPTSNHCVGNVCTRTPFQGMKNGIPTNNVIPQGYLSPIALKMASFMPAPSNPAVLANNFLGGYPSGFDNHVEDYRVDFDLSAKQRLSTVGAIGAVHYLNNFGRGGSGAAAYGWLPFPYVAGTVANIFPSVYTLEDVYQINDRMVNQLKFGFTRFPQPQVAATDGKAQYSPSAMGITNIPVGQASSEFPGASFGQTGAISTTLTGWTQRGGGAATQEVTPNTYTALDNFQWVKGRHSMTFGFTYSWEEINTSAPVGYTSLVQLTYNSNDTAQYASNSNALSAASGVSYASYLLGAVGGAPSLGLQPVSEVGGRYRLAAPYVEDNWKVTSKLTLDLGLRWDYFSPFHEVKNHWTFLNPTLTNAATGTPGMLQFAGNYGGAGVSCGCQTPVQTYWKNFGPRVGLAYAVDDKTVFRAGIGQVFSQAGGVGGRGGNAGGTGQTGFNISAIANPELTNGPAAGPSFYLNNGAQFTSLGMANTDLLGKGFAYPANPTPNAAAQLLQTGNYLDSNGKLVNAGGVSFADYYISGRAPEFIFFNVGIERSITQNMTVQVNYVGNQSHFLSTGGNVRGYWANQLNPIYLAGLGAVKDSTGTKPILIAAATSANVAKAQAAMPGIAIPTTYQNAANANPSSSTLTIAHGLVAFPQYSGVNDLWGSNSGNQTYHSLQIALERRMSNGLTFNINYTYSKNIGDDGTFRSGFAIPSAAISGGGKSWRQDRMDRSWTAISSPESLHAFGVYQIPFGTAGHLGSGSSIMRALAGGWQLSGIYTYGSGTPIAVTSSACSGTTYPGQGQCMPDIAPGATNARINGSYGTGPNGTTACNLGAGQNCPSGAIKYVDSTKFETSANISATSSAIYLIGNAPRTRPLNLNNPGNQNLDTSLRRSFSLPREIGKLVFEVDCLNTWNKVTFSGPAATFGNSNFGQIGGISNSPRDFQFAGHFNF